MTLQSPAPSSIADLPVFRAAGLKASKSCGSWGLENLVGILAEISEETPSGAVSFVAEIIGEAQTRNEPVAWVAGMDSVFFPPDFHQRGIDLSAVAVVRVQGETDSLTAAEWLIRSGAMGLVIVDLGGNTEVNDASLGRILKLAERNLCAVVFLTQKRALDPSLGSRISLRGCITRSPVRPLAIDIQTIKDKRASSRGRQSRQYSGHAGMRPY